jgi:hypothetical protein
MSDLFQYDRMCSGIVIHGDYFLLHLINFRLKHHLKSRKLICFASLLFDI